MKSVFVHVKGRNNLSCLQHSQAFKVYLTAIMLYNTGTQGMMEAFSV